MRLGTGPTFSESTWPRKVAALSLDQDGVMKDHGCNCKRGILAACKASVILMRHDDMDQMIDGEPGLLSIFPRHSPAGHFCSRDGIQCWLRPCRVWFMRDRGGCPGSHAGEGDRQGIESGLATPPPPCTRRSSATDCLDPPSRRIRAPSRVERHMSLPTSHLSRVPVTARGDAPSTAKCYVILPFAE